MKAIDFLVAVHDRGTSANVYTVMHNTIETPVTSATFGDNVEMLYGEIPADGMAAIYFANNDGVDLANTLFRRFNVSPDAMIIADKRAIGIFKLR